MDRQKGRQRQTGEKTDRQTYGQTEAEAEAKMDRQTKRNRNKEREGGGERERERERERAQVGKRLPIHFAHPGLECHQLLSDATTVTAPAKR